MDIIEHIAHSHDLLAAAMAKPPVAERPLCPRCGGSGYDNGNDAGDFAKGARLVHAELSRARAASERVKARDDDESREYQGPRVFVGNENFNKPDPNDAGGAE